MDRSWFTRARTITEIAGPSPAGPARFLSSWGSAAYSKPGSPGTPGDAEVSTTHGQGLAYEPIRTRRSSVAGAAEAAYPDGPSLYLARDEPAPKDERITATMMRPTRPKSTTMRRGSAATATAKPTTPSEPARTRPSCDFRRPAPPRGTRIPPCRHQLDDVGAPRNDLFVPVRRRVSIPLIPPKTDALDLGAVSRYPQGPVVPCATQRPRQYPRDLRHTPGLARRGVVAARGFRAFRVGGEPSRPRDGSEPSEKAWRPSFTDPTPQSSTDML